MHRPEINLFRHPTTTVYIDDSTAFLYSITLGVDHRPFRSFSDPLAGLEYVEQYAHNYDQDLPENDNRHSTPNQEQYLGRNYSHLMPTKLHNNARFAEPSVVVVDYSMPQMNGLDLCSRITNPYIKKVLLTGVADEKIAIKALNTEIIDFYISKSESSLSQELYRIITMLRDRYFQDIYGWTKDIRLKKLVPYLYNNDFADFFEDVCEELEIVEHYPIESPWGMLLISKLGEPFILTISNTQSSNNQNNYTGVNSVILKSTTIELTHPANQYVCTIHSGQLPENLQNIRTFDHYLQSPGLSVPIVNIHQDSQRHDH